MTKHDRSTNPINDHIEEIRELEKQLIGLKRRFLESASSSLEHFIEESETIPFLITIAKERPFAIPVSIVEEVVEMVAVTPIIEQRQGLLGMINYHGKLIALFDLTGMVGMGMNDLTSDNVIIICNLDGKFAGVMVSEATDVYMINKKDIEISEEVLPGSTREIGVVKYPEGTAGIVDIWPILMGVRPEMLKQSIVPDSDGGDTYPKDDAP
jgi:purine-binding chemotaxis protein CheW